MSLPEIWNVIVVWYEQNGWYGLVVEGIGWFSTAVFLASIVMPRRLRLHIWGMVTSVATGFYAYEHGATAIWVKWLIAFFFHGYMWWKLKSNAEIVTTA